jgi:hypothetical protein
MTKLPGSERKCHGTAKTPAPVPISKFLRLDALFFFKSPLI